MLGGFRFHGKCPCIVSSDLSTKEAAEIALRKAELRVSDDGIPYGSSSTSRCYFEKAGLVLAELRKSEVDASSDVELAIRIEALLDAGGLPRRLSDCGVDRENLPALASEASNQWTASFNPRPIGREGLLGIYEAAFD